MKFKQTLLIIITSENHDSCLAISKPLKKQCEAWFFCVDYKETKSARKGKVLKRELMINQEANSNDILIFKESIKRICFHLDSQLEPNIKFIDQGSIPIEKY
jgi:hypothetical protein